ncbi:hypothetical protein GUITHDRAFT_166370 [Guillardia theta CCMP2712]|uniref:NADH dehydrogenase [ubiquinone] 1 alpha subcomplex subunit 12 n=1 Tax=Guillardia theta (strain CCMP2712) TaxID=905079 RepID=L1ICN9_GUITC|nr:hypothetical protein GUITHDRAFT_166370 [Guillardia theta CCMP2712]EKX33832.1 hypothetical protein GUITHDRAFT_166370 [Guillardia theta CCMP2712]|eukprot:XP_005820812.1 hypothetical protein GUITHDRAFT_166370 [Guillardia theta CCMP2712]
MQGKHRCRELGTRSIVSYLQALSNRIQGKKFIGADEHGNKFWEIANPGGVPDPKREIEFVSKDMVDFSMNEIPSEWRMWLKHHRKDPPTEEEILSSQYEQQTTRANAKIVEERDKAMGSASSKQTGLREVEEYDPTK